MRTLKELEEACNSIAVELMGDLAPCRRMRLGVARAGSWVSCVTQEELRKLTPAERRKGWVRRPFGGYDAAQMCESCAAYWHASMARIHLLGVIRWDGLAEVEQHPKAVTP